MWYVEYLLLNKDYIKLKEDLDCDEYNDLLLVESTLEKMHELFSPAELRAINFMFDGLPESKTRMQKTLLAKNFRIVCKKISSVLGGSFTDKGYLEYMQEKYNLSDEQVRTLEQYMLSEFRHKIMSKPYKEN